MKKLISLMTFLVVAVFGTHGQRTFDIRLISSNVSCETNEFCYDVQIKSGDDMLWRFAGQNYRLFYNGALAEFDRVERVLDAPYSEPELVQNVQHLDLSAEGNLPFDSDLSWLNYFIDMNVAEEAMIISPNVWTTTSTICFTSLVDLMSEEEFCFEMVWAREDLTFNYATAFVEVSEWVTTNSTNDHVVGSEYHDFITEDGDDGCLDLVCGSNPPSYDSRITLKSSDSETGINCYAIEMKSASSRTWQIGDQQYSILFDGEQASFLSAQSSITGSGTLTMGDSVLNEAFPNGSGNITFENNVSAISFTIPRGESMMMLGDAYTEVAEFCLDIEEGAQTDNCLEIVIGREGFTDEYFDAETEILYSEEVEAIAQNFQDYNKCSETECPELAAPISNGDVTICMGDDIPLLSVQATDGMDIRWYATAIGGTPLAQGETYGPAGPGIFYAEYYSADENCTSSDRTPVALISTPLPDVQVVSKECNSDRSTYAVVISAVANNVIADKGSVEKLIGLEWMISNVPAGDVLSVTLSNSATGCDRIENIESPNCDCEVVDAPVSRGDEIICMGESLPSLYVDISEENTVVDWYASMEGGSPIATNQLEYTPANVNRTGTYTYYAQARSLETECVSATRASVTLTVLDPPVYAFVDTDRSEDFNNYAVVFYSDANLITADYGEVSSDENGVWRVTGIPADSTVTISITSVDGCTITRTVSSPEWECDKILAPICEGQFTICEGMDYPGFKAFAYPGKGIRWYDARTGGTLLAEGNLFKPTMSGTYYAEAYDSISACVSQDRSEVQLVINPMPSLQLANDVFCEGETLVWADFVTDISGADGSISVFSDFRDAMNNENAITEPSLVISDIEAYFIRKTSSSGCFDIETVIIVPENCGGPTCLADYGNYGIVQVPCIGLDSATIRWAEISPARIPTDYTEAYIIAQGNEIIDIAPTTEYKLITPGRYTVHSFVFLPFDPALDDALGSDGIGIAELAALLAPNGGEICGALDTEGLLFDVMLCPDMCRAQAGTTTPRDIDCLDDAVELLYDSDPLSVSIPEGFVQTFVLTSGSDLVIIGAGNDPFFVNSVGEYRVHSLVFDPSTLDMGLIVPGVTRAAEVLALLMQGGGDICGSLDVNGALFQIEECVDECEAEHEELIAIADLCVGDEPINVTPGRQGGIIPEGYVSTIVLTTGDDLIIQDIQSESFTISEPQSFTVHSFVYDPESLDLSSVTLGVTSASEVLSLLIQGGGDACGSLDVEGTTFTIEECDEELIDLELVKEISNESPVIGEEITFTLTVSNESDTDATGVSVVDYLPQGYTLTGNISHDGTSSNEADETEINWSNIDIAAEDFVILSFMARVADANDIAEYKNIAEITSADQEDTDSTPDNDDGDQSEDDEDSVMPSVSDALIDLELVKTADAVSAVAGQSITFNINLSNRAMTVATGVEVTDMLPEGVNLSTVRNISNGGQLVGNSIVWPDLELGFLSTLNLSFTVDLDEDLSESVVMNTAQVSAADQADVDSTPNNDDGDQSEDDESETTLQVRAPFIDLSLTKEASNMTPFPGDIVTFIISVRNDGIVPATGVTVADMLPMGGFDLGSIQGISPAGQVVGNNVIWTIDEITPGQSMELSFDVIVNPDADNYTNIAQVTSADQQDPDSTPNNDDGDQSEDDEDSITIIPIMDEGMVDIEITKSVSTISPAIGDVVDYTIVVSNNGPSTATNLVVRDVTPDGIDAVDVTGNPTQANGVITWTIPILAAGESMTFTYNSIVFESATDDYCNVVQLMSVDQEDVDSTPNNDDGDQSEDDEDKANLFPVVPQFIDLELDKGIRDACAQYGERVSYFISVFNNSAATATGVSVEDLIPEGITNIEAISNGGTLSGDRIVWEGLSLLPNEDIGLSFTAEVVEGASSYTNTAQITAADQEDIDSTPNNDDGDQSEDDEDSFTINVGVGVDLELEKLVDNSHALPGERVQFTIRLTNNGCEDATGVAVRDILPGGYKAIRNISNGGIRTANIILWEDITVAPGSVETLSFTAEIVHFSINCDYINVAEIYAADQEDVDSTPGNDDGDQSEDDEDTAEVFAGTMADLTLNMITNTAEVVAGDMVTYTLSLCNEGPGNAFNVQVRDYLPEGIRVVGDINYKGQLTDNEITWSGFTVVTGQCADLSFQAEIMDASATNEIVNEAEIVLSDQLDPDSSPGNGMLGEDDDTQMMITQYVATAAATADLSQGQKEEEMVEVNIQTALYLEGAYNKQTGQLNTTLNKLGYLPGQKPKSYFASPTPAGQPFSQGPWNYEGTEGMMYDHEADFYLSYPDNVVDWVLVSVREDKTPESTVASRAGLLLSDGTVMFSEDTEPFYLDATKSYYVLVQHRNHLPIMSPQPLEVSNGNLTFDFRTNESYIGLLGSGQKDVNGIYCVFAANGEQLDNTLSQFDINVRDMNAWFESNGQNSSYMIADFDMNGDVNVKDQLIWLINNGVFSDIPR